MYKRNQIIAGIISTVMIGSSIMLAGCQMYIPVNQVEVEKIETIDEAEKIALEAIAEEAGIVVIEADKAVAEDANEALEEDNIIYYPDPSVKEYLPDVRPEAKDDLYLYSNYDFLSTYELKPGYSSYGTLNIMGEQTEADTKALLTKEYAEFTDNQNVKLVYGIYSKFIDMDKRNEAGWDSIVPYVEGVMAANSIDELLDLAEENSIIASSILPFGITQSIDIKNSPYYITTLNVPGLGLEDSAEYKNPTELGEIFKKANDEYDIKLLVKYGYSEDEAQEMVANVYRWDEMISEYIYPVETSYREDYADLTYNVYTKDELTQLMDGFPIERAIDVWGLGDVDKFNVTEPDYFDNIASCYNDDNIELIKCNSVSTILSIAADITDEEAMEYWNEWNNTVTGSSGSTPIDEKGYEFVSAMLGEVVGDIYAREYFSPEMKAEAERIVISIVDAMRERITKEEWMSEDTKEKAIEKLNDMHLAIGYPEKFIYDYEKLEISEEDDLFTTYLKISDFFVEETNALVGKRFDSEAWGSLMAPNVLNACYIPEFNMMIFPAAILHDPVFSLDNTISQNYGGLGIVAGHEMTHGFDTNGSQFDKNGNMVNWWTDEDRAAFSKLTEKVSERYGRYAIVDDNCVNGDLTIGETVADLGGTAACLDALHKLEAEGEEINFKEFFETNAIFWHRLLTRENALSRLKTDPHAPTSLRVNVNLTQFEEFYDAYGVKEGDAMYTAPEDRLSVW